MGRPMTENLKRRDDLKDLDADGMILKESWINMVVECGVIWFGEFLNPEKSRLHGVCCDWKFKDQ
jgi:hypothetical protein